MSGVALVGLAAEGNENTFLNDSQYSICMLRNSDTTIQHFSMYKNERNCNGPLRFTPDSSTELTVRLPAEDDGIGAGFLEIRLPDIQSTRQESISWNKNLVSSMIDSIQLKGNKVVIKEYSGKQLLDDSKSKLNTTRYSVYSRLTKMTPNQYYPHYSTYTDRYYSHRYPAMNHTAVRTHSPFSHMVDRPVDLGVKLSSPAIRPDLWLQHIRVSYPDSFFTSIGVSRDNLTLTSYENATIHTLSTVNVSTQLQSIFSHEWNAIQLYTSIPNLVISTPELYTLSNEITQRNLFIHSNRDDIEMFLKTWQEIETDWTNQSFLTTKAENAPWSAMITQIDTTSTPHILRLQTEQTLATNTIYTFTIQRDQDSYGFPNQTHTLIGRLETPTSISLLSSSVSTSDIGNPIILAPGRFVGYVNSTQQIPNSTLSDTEYYEFTIQGTNTLSDMYTLGFQSGDSRRLRIGNVVADVYQVNTGEVSIQIPHSGITNITAFENTTVMLEDPHEFAGSTQPNATILYRQLRDAFPTSWDTNAQTYVTYRNILENSTTISAIPELYSNTSINYIIQDSISNSTGVVQSPIGYELDKIDILLSTIHTEYSQNLTNSLNVFKGLQEPFEPDRYGGYYPEFTKVQTYLHAMNHVYLRLRNLPEVKSDSSVNLTVSQLLPKVIQQYGRISYHYHSDIFRSWTPEIHSLVTQVGDSFANSTIGWFPGTAANTALILSGEPAQFPNTSVMPSTLFSSTIERNTLMNQIDYVNGTSTFMNQLEAGTHYSTQYFTLQDIPATPSVSDITNEVVYRFIFWWRVFDFLDKCRLVKEVWEARLYDLNQTYNENLDNLVGVNLDVWVYCIQFYDLFRQRYPILYDELRVRAPTLTQQNLPFSREVYYPTPELPNVSLMSESYDVIGATPQSPNDYLYHTYRFPQETPTAFSHLYSFDSNSYPHSFALQLWESTQTNVTNSNTWLIGQELTNNTDLLGILTERLLQKQQDTATQSLYSTLTPFIYSVLENTSMEDENATLLSQLVPNSSSVVLYPTRQTGGFFESHLGSTMGYIVVKEFATGIPYEGFQTETQDWANVNQYDNRVSNVVSDLGPYISYQLSARDILSLSLNSTGINLSTFFSTPLEHTSPQVFGYRVNLGNPLPVSYEPRTYRSYHYRVPKYVPQAKWYGCDTSLVAMLSNPLIEYFEYLRINLVHPDDIPASLVATNYAEIVSQQDDPWILSHSKNSLDIISSRLLDTTNRDASLEEIRNLTEEVGWRTTEAAKVMDPITGSFVPAFEFPGLYTKVNASRNPLRNESPWDMNLRLLYRTYIASQNRLDQINAIEIPNYIPRHVQDIVFRIVLRSMQNWLFHVIEHTTPSHPTIEPITELNALIDRQEYMNQEIRSVLTEFTRFVSRSNIPVENHRSVKLAWTHVWIRWKSMMNRMIRLGVMDEIMEVLIRLIKEVYTTSMVPALSLNQYDLERRTQVWMELMNAVLDVEGMLRIEIDPTKTDDDWVEQVYRSMSEYTRNRVMKNPFVNVSEDLVAFKNIILNLMVSM